MNSCGAKYILNDCSCLADPLNFYSTICGYVSKQNGLVYPCDAGCCLGNCENKNPVTRQEVRPSAGIDLPPGYGVNIPQSNEPTSIPGASDFAPPSRAGAQTGYKVWQIVLIALIPLFLILILAPFLT